MLARRWPWRCETPRPGCGCGAEERTLPALRALLELPFELVLVSHGEPVHDRAAFEAALAREPWSEWTGA